MLKIEAHGPNALRVRAVPSSPEHNFRDDLVSALEPLPPNAVCADADAAVLVAPANYSNGNLRAQLDAAGLLSFWRVSDGHNGLLLKEAAPRALQPAAATALQGFLSLDLAFEAVEGERIYGLGQHKTGALDNKGVAGLKLAPQNTEILVPVAHSSVGYAFLLNLPAFGAVEYNESGSFWQADAVLQADFWVATTQDSAPHTRGGTPWGQLQAAYVNATGHAPVYPEWASGFWQSKNRYKNQSQLLDAAAGYISRGHPLSLMIIDYYSWQPGALGDESLPAECWPDPSSMVEELRAQGVELMISPYFHSLSPQSAPFPAALARNLLVRSADGSPAEVGYDSSYLYDVFQPEARAYAFEQVQRGYIDLYGLNHWWLDCDEPCGGDMTKLVYNNGTWPAAFVGAAYPHLVHQMVYEGMSPHYASDNVMLSRSAWAGSQRFGAAVWSGDTHSDFANLNQQFRAGLNMMMSGIPYWTTDAAGYSGGDISDPTFRELAVRWFQWAAFCPIFRNHGRRSGGADQEGGDPACGKTGSSNEIWNFGAPAEAAIGRVMALREQLRPYIMSLYKEAAAQGTPPMRPMFYDFWDQPASLTIDDEMMFGPDYLVAPQLQQGATNRSVWLPQLPSAFIWRNVFTGALVDSGAGAVTVVEQTPLDTFPLYFRAPRTTFPPPPSPPVCDNSCSTVANTDADGYGQHIYPDTQSPSYADCCAKCKANSNCTHFVRGPYKGVETCFLLQHVQAFKASSDRSIGCVRM